MALVTLPRQLVVDSNGTPRVGAKLYVYDAGTTTPHNSYTTPALDIPHSNPVLSLSAGLFPAIYVNPDDGDYKLVCKDSNDLTLWTEDDINPLAMTQAEIGAVLYPITSSEQAAGVTPVNRVYPPYDLLRLGAACNGVTDDTNAVRNAALVGGLWKVPVGGRVRITGTVTLRKGSGFYSDAPVSTAPGTTQAFLIHDFSGTFFDLVGNASDNKEGAGITFRNIALVQNHGDGTSSSGVCIRNVATSDNQVCHWLRMENFHIEVASGKNDWTGSVLLDGMANTSGTTQLRDIFLSRGRIVAGTNCSYAIKSNGAQNIFLSDVLGNLANAKLILTGDATHLASSIALNGCSFSDIDLDYATNVRGAGNSASNFTSTANTADVDLGLDTGVSAPTILGTRVTVFGLRSDGKWAVNSNNTVRFELSTNAVEFSAAVAAGTTPATAGPVRIPNAASIQARNAANSANIEVIQVDANDRVKIAPDGGQDIVWGRTKVALGGGAAPTVGTIGGSGPASAGQSAWLKVYDSAGDPFFIPVWA